MKTLIIFNPAAGKAAANKRQVEQLRRRLRASVRVTRKKDDACWIARRAARDGFDYIVAAGGDGTLNEVVNGIAAQPSLIRAGLLPLGTGNDFARSLNLPSSISDNIDILVGQRITRIDLVRVTAERTRYVINVSSGGFSSLVDRKLTPKIKRAWGPAAYARSAAAAFPKLHGYRTSIVLDQDERFSIDLYNVIVANGRYVAGGMPVAPRANPKDGLLDVILIRKRSKAETVLLAAQMLAGKHLSNDAVLFRRARKVSVRSRPGMWFNADGELVGHVPATFDILPRALKFVVGRR